MPTLPVSSPPPVNPTADFSPPSVPTFGACLSRVAGRASSLGRCWIAEPFTKYVASPIEYRLIGDVRSIDFSKENGDFALHSLGLFGSIAKWCPATKEELAPVLHKLDDEPDARFAYRVLHLLVNAPPFLLDESNVFAKDHR